MCDAVPFRRVGKTSHCNRGTVIHTDNIGRGGRSRLLPPLVEIGVNIRTGVCLTTTFLSGVSYRWRQGSGNSTGVVRHLAFTAYLDSLKTIPLPACDVVPLPVGGHVRGCNKVLPCNGATSEDVERPRILDSIGKVAILHPRLKDTIAQLHVMGDGRRIGCKLMVLQPGEDTAKSAKYTPHGLLRNILCSLRGGRIEVLHGAYGDAHHFLKRETGRAVYGQLVLSCLIHARGYESNMGVLLRR